MIHILLADDHSLIRDGITKLLEDEPDIQIVGSCNNGQEVLDNLPKVHVDVLLLDLDMPILNGLQCAEIVKQEFPDIKIAILTMHQEKSLIQRFIELGVKGYFLKTILKKELVYAVRAIAEGGEYFPNDVTKALIQNKIVSNLVTQSPLVKDLTNREIEIITLISQGFSSGDMAEKLFISPRTVDTHRTNILRKLELHSVAEIVRFAFQNSIVV